MSIRGGAARAASGAVSALTVSVFAGLTIVAAGPAWADPGLAPDAVAPGDPAVPVDPGLVESAEPATTQSPDGWTLKISAKDETQVNVAPLTTAISSREYVVGGVFNGALTGPGETPHGVFEVGYQIGCGIDMSTSNGVSLTGTASLNPSVGYFGFDFPGVLPDGLLPGIGASIGGGITVGLKPGMVNTYPVTKKEYKSSAPWVSISNFHVKIDGCVGESFIRSYATLTKSNDSGDAILSWYGVTRAV
jgi:hypothetical protein